MYKLLFFSSLMLFFLLQWPLCSFNLYFVEKVIKDLFKLTILFIAMNSLRCLRENGLYCIFVLANYISLFIYLLIRDIVSNFFLLIILLNNFLLLLFIAITFKWNMSLFFNFDFNLSLYHFIFLHGNILLTKFRSTLI